MVKNMVTTVSVKEETLAILKELSSKSRIPLTNLLEDLANLFKPLIKDYEAVSMVYVNEPKTKSIRIQILPMIIGSFEAKDSDTEEQIDGKIHEELKRKVTEKWSCLLYTSDAADE